MFYKEERNITMLSMYTYPSFIVTRQKRNITLLCHKQSIPNKDWKVSDGYLTYTNFETQLKYKAKRRILHIN